MGIESDIINEVESNLNTVKTTNGYQLTLATVETRDENVHWHALPDASLPACFVRFGRIAQAQDSFVDSPRIGRVQEGLPFFIRGVVKAAIGGDSPTLLASKLIEDVKAAIGDNLRQNVAAVDRVEYRGVSFPFDTFGTRYEVVDFQYLVFFSWEAREYAEIVAPGTPQTLLPKNVSITLQPGQAFFSFTVPDTADGVNIYRDSVKVVTLTPNGTWVDVDNHEWTYYQLGGEDGAGNELKTPLLFFPYYPTSSPEADYYQPSWWLGTAPLGTTALGDTSVETLIEHQFRTFIERERLYGGKLVDVAYTSIGPLPNTHLIPSRYPLVSINALGSIASPDSTQESQIETRIRIRVVASADNDDNDLYESPFRVNTIAGTIRTLMIADNKIGTTTNQNNPTTLSIVRVRPPQLTRAVDAAFIGNHRVFMAEVLATVIHKLPWR